MTKKKNFRNAWNIGVVLFGECSDGCDESYTIELKTLYASSATAAWRKVMKLYAQKCNRFTKESAEIDPYEYRQYSVEHVFVKHVSEKSRTDKFVDPILELEYDVWSNAKGSKRRFWFSWENPKYEIQKRCEMIVAGSRKEALRSFRWNHSRYDHIPIGAVVSCEDLTTKRKSHYSVREGGRYVHVNNVG